MYWTFDISVALKNEEKESVLRMPPRLHENILHPDNQVQMLKRTGLQSALLSEDGLVVLRADSEKSLGRRWGS